MFLDAQMRRVAEIIPDIKRHEMVELPHGRRFPC